MVQNSTFLLLLIGTPLGWAGQAVADEHVKLTFRLAEATEQHLGKKIVCQSNGKVAMAPTVRGVISKRAMVNSQSTGDEMRRIFDALVLQKHE
ncbi:MAG: hypothetical protein ACPGLY_15300 [Rubripirellula sp.]